MTAPNWLSWIENTLLVPGSPKSMALTTQSTSPDVRFVRAVPQTKRVPVGWWSMPAPTLSKKYAVIRVHCTCSPSPRSVSSRWPQLGEPPLHCLGFPAAGTGRRRRDHHVGHARDDRVKRVHHGGTVRGNSLLVDDHDASGDVDPLIRVPGHPDGQAIDREIVDAGEGNTGGAEDRQGPRHDEVGADVDPGDAQVEGGE